MVAIAVLDDYQNVALRMADWTRLRENHRVTEARFAQGQATGLEVVDAWLATEKADLEKLSAAGEGWSSRSPGPITPGR